MFRSQKLGVVVPAYNEERFIQEVVATMPDFVDRIFVVNDASTDRTSSILSRMDDPRVMVVTHPRNLGAGAAMISGYKEALREDMDVVAIMAGDGQMDPAILHQIVSPVAERRADYSKGNRLSNSRHRHGMPVFRLFGNSLLTLLVKISSGYWNVDDPMNGYTAISKQSLRRIDLDKVEQGYAFETDILVKLNVNRARVVNVPMASRYRGEKSKIVYLNFVAHLSLVLVRCWGWRMWQKYLNSAGLSDSYLHPVGLDESVAEIERRTSRSARSGRDNLSLARTALKRYPGRQHATNYR